MVQVEGEVNIMRNLLCDRFHSLTVDNLEAKKIVKSAVSVAPTKCCYDFDVEGKAYHTNWQKAYSEFVKNRAKAAETDSYEENDENELKNDNTQFSKKYQEEGDDKVVHEDLKRKKVLKEENLEGPVNKKAKESKEEILLKKRTTIFEYFQ